MPEWEIQENNLILKDNRNFHDYMDMNFTMKLFNYHMKIVKFGSLVIENGTYQSS